MSEKRDFYEILDCEKTASEAELKAAYRKLALKWHPDKNQGNTEAEEKFKEISEAYIVLKDPDKRAQYDQFGHAAFEGGGQGGMSMDMNAFDDLFSNIFKNYQLIYQQESNIEHKLELLVKEKKEDKEELEEIYIF